MKLLRRLRPRWKDELLIDPLVVEEFSRPMTSTFVVVLMSVGVSLLSSVGRRFLTNVERTRRVNMELKAWRTELKEAITSKNKAKEEKLRKKEKQMNQLQARMARENMKPTLFFFVPLIGLWYLMSWLVGLDTVVAVSPIPIDLFVIVIGPPLTLFWWYMISSFAVSGIITRAFGLSVT